MGKSKLSLLLFALFALCFSVSAYPRWYAELLEDPHTLTRHKAALILHKFGFSQEYELLQSSLYGHKHKRGSDCPYHNIEHAEAMVKNCFEGAVASGVNIPNNKPYPEEVKDLVLAALFHDYGHGCGDNLNDEDNIQIAVQGYMAVSTQLLKQPRDSVIALIEVTRFPIPKKSKVQWTIYDRIIRDSDMLQILEPNWKRQVMHGLREEFQSSLAKARGTDRELGFIRMLGGTAIGAEGTYIDWLKAQAGFFNGQYWDLGQSDWGLELKNNNKPGISAKIQQLIADEEKKLQLRSNLHNNGGGRSRRSRQN